jgi:rhamnulokinase
VVGFGSLGPDDIFLNVGTWTLAGCLLDNPIATPEAGAAGYTNERAADGRVRFLKNIPGFYFINRLHGELGITTPVPAWLASATAHGELVDLLRPEFFNPESMLEICKSLCACLPSTSEGWAGFALLSLCDAICRSVPELESLTGRKFRQIRVGGGGSQSQSFCQALADRCGLPVLAGPAEATVMGNLGAQFLAQGACAHWKDVYEAIDRSIEVIEHSPQGG